MNVLQPFRRALLQPQPALKTLASWRAHVLSRILFFVVILGACIALPSVTIALIEGLWPIAVADFIALAWVVTLWRKPTLAYPVRAWNFCALLYLLGFSFLFTVGMTSQIYLMAVPVMAALLLGPRPALFALGLNAFTLFGVGYLADVSLSIAGFEAQPLLRWIVITLNFTLVDAMMTLSIVVLLQGLEMSLASARESEALYRATFDEAPIGVSRLDLQGRWLQVNRKLCDITGYNRDEMLGLYCRDITHPEDIVVDQAGTEALLQGEIDSQDREKRYLPKRGGFVWVQVRTSLVRAASGEPQYFVAVAKDITERKNAQARINQLAFFDPLTGLPNRTLFLDRLHQALSASARDGSFGALLSIGLDHFKSLNDTLGHNMGDLLLQQVGRRLRHCVREGDSVARLGGDEFGVLLAGLSTTDDLAAARAETIADEILVALNQVYQLGNLAHHSTPSIGVTLFDAQRVEIEELMQQADLAMYWAKSSGRNAARFFDPAMQAAVMERAVLERDLRQAIDGQQLRLYYQAQIGGRGYLTGAEALVRWQHPQRGLVSPGDFIPLAEETGLILPLGQWVLHTACSQLAAWAEQPKMAHLTVAVNVSARQFQHPGFVNQVLEVLQATGANPKRLKLELTESLLVSNIEELIEKMLRLKTVGVGFELDDFGTGYSSLSYLKRLPLEQLKIDQSFVRDVLNDPNDAIIARTVVTLARSLGLGVIAEGVETEAQRDFLTSVGCHSYQGYFFSRPLPLEGFEAFARADLSVA